MFRFGEAFLAVAPLLAAALLYGIAFRRLPSRRAVLLIAVVEAGFAASLIWQGTEGMRPHEAYVPARLHDGAVLEGHGN